MSRPGDKRSILGFTAVELSVTISIIAILAGIVIWSVNSWRARVATTEVTSDLTSAKAAMESARNFSNGYPTGLPYGLAASKNVNLTYSSGNSGSYCVDGSSKSVASVTYFLYVDAAQTQNEPKKGTCATGEAIPGPIVAGWSDISAGRSTVCSIVNSRAYCTGQNTYGEVGDNSTTDRTVATIVTPTGLLSGKKVTDIGAGDDHTCALAEGNVYCWGRNELGSLGTGNNKDSLTPVAINTSGVLAGKTITALSVGRYHTCVIASGALYCWGYNSYGQLGNGTFAHANAPVAVTASGVLLNKTVTAVSAGDDHTCAIASGAAYCWGANMYGQLGDNTYVDKTVPVAVYASAGPFLGKTIDSIASGVSHTCAVASGAAYCWGYNTSGQVGDNTNANKSIPTAVYAAGVLSGKTVTSVQPGNFHTCAIASGAAYCWGDNVYGQLGDATTVQKSVPVAVNTAGVLAGKTISMLTVSRFTSCALANANTYCWGYGGWGQLGNGSTVDSSVPVQSTTPS